MNTTCCKAFKQNTLPFLCAAANFYCKRPEAVHTCGPKGGFVKPETNWRKVWHFGNDGIGSPSPTVLALVLMLPYCLPATQDPIPASHFCQDTLGTWVVKFLIIVFEKEFGYWMFRVQYDWMDIVAFKVLCSPEPTSHSDEIKVIVIFRRQWEQFVALRYKLIIFKGIELLWETLRLGPM